MIRVELESLSPGRLERRFSGTVFGGGCERSTDSTDTSSFQGCRSLLFRELQTYRTRMPKEISYTLYSGSMKRFLTALVKVYQSAVSPFLGRRCRFYPSCSQYMIEAIEKKGSFRGLVLGIWRILRCNPWNKNFGYDPVDKEKL